MEASKSRLHTLVAPPGDQHGFYQYRKQGLQTDLLESACTMINDRIATRSYTIVAMITLKSLFMSRAAVTDKYGLWS